jgi:NosR/NirI family transcriptional regulator, nitrous oxide reductase regulator
MRATLSIGAMVLGASVILAGQSSLDGRTEVQLERLFPTATTFSSKQSSPPHFKAFRTDSSGQPTLVGVAFWTTEIEPLERGYDGPIKILVGMNLQGILTGVVVAAHHEPYGYFSVDRKEFAAQFVGKDIRDPFQVGSDVDAVSRASISIASATRAIRNSARRVARQLLTPPTADSTGK